MVALPRLVIAAPASGHGKTTIATGLMAALVSAGHRVSGHKVGPDYIDPGYHSLATGLPGRNLDPHLVGEEKIVPLLLHGAADLAVIEGVMGLFDGQIGGEGFASTAHVASLTQSPVVLVVDISHASRTIGAVVQGLVNFDASLRIGGVILNKAGSDRHATEVAKAIESAGVPVLGVLGRDDGIVAPSRHLGLIPAAERGDAAASVERLATRIAERVDLAAIIDIADSAPALDAEPWSPPLSPVAGAPTIAVAGGRSFTFRYAETTEMLEAAGCRVVEFDPLTDSALPDGTQGLYLGGGFPEVHAAGLTANASLRAHIREAVLDGLPTVAECAGLLYLCRSVDGAPMVGAIDADAVMTPRLTLAYRRAALPTDSLLGPAGRTATGHEFHRTTVTPGHGDTAAWAMETGQAGFASATLHASYLHTHWAGSESLAQAFANATASSRPASPPAKQPDLVVKSTFISEFGSIWEPNLAWHGDRELSEGLVDFAVNVFDGARPDFLSEALVASLADVTSYPDARNAEAATARRHSRRAEEVLATSGAAEAFTLIARMRPWRNPVIVHPQFTEPDVALTAAGHAPRHVVLDAMDNFALDPDAIPADADLVVVGNPTNPTSVLHPAARLRALLAPGRVVVIDEAFMDSTDERQSLADVSVPGLLVTRSLTKLWAIPGIRAGYVLGDPGLIAELRAQQTPWSVSGPAAAAIEACAGDDARAETQRRIATIAANRSVLTQGLTDLGIEFVASPAGPFVLARTGAGAHARLREAGFAVRRCDTFPGLDDSWIRIAVKNAADTRRLLAALAR